ncbi:unnamed protein product, partial [Nesidiocoris tenuis]
MWRQKKTSVASNSRTHCERRIDYIDFPAENSQIGRFESQVNSLTYISSIADEHLRVCGGRTLGPVGTPTINCIMSNLPNSLCIRRGIIFENPLVRKSRKAYLCFQ